MSLESELEDGRLVKGQVGPATRPEPLEYMDDCGDQLVLTDLSDARERLARLRLYGERGTNDVRLTEAAAKRLRDWLDTFLYGV